LGQPFTLRFDAVNLLDQVYKLRDGNRYRRVSPAIGTLPDLSRRPVAKDLKVA
jgi:hypothetical protein